MSNSAATSLGLMLKAWRTQRHYTQLKLAELATISAKHLSFVETGRASPSREMVLRLAAALDVPLGVRNSMLMAAGYAPIHPTRDLSVDDTMVRVRAILSRLIERHEPYPAVVVLRNGELVLANNGMSRLMHFLGLAPAVKDGGRPNLMLSIFDPNGIRPYVLDWPDCARIALRRLARDADALGGDPELLGLIERISKIPGVPTDWRHVCKWDESVPCMSFSLVRDGVRLNFISTMTSFGTPQDVTLQGLTIESFFPSDEETEERWREITTTRLA
ncbi:MAG TPA: helix-turn-helix transcriptional regulator [Polyangiaceae bacterium]|nr:helix-turn-helix transcriptional regulator [Polyangiaceae bacterium]